MKANTNMNPTKKYLITSDDTKIANELNFLYEIRDTMTTRQSAVRSWTAYRPPTAHHGQTAD